MEAKDASQTFNLIATTSDRIYVKLEVLSIEYIGRSREAILTTSACFLSFHWIHAIDTDEHELYRVSHTVNKLNRSLSLAAGLHLAISINSKHLISDL